MNKNFTSNNHRSAFTLVELAIVIVVLGILVSGVLMGQSIINSAKVSGVIKEIEQMKTAIRAYQLEFGQLPGDHEEAYDYFGDECGNDDIAGRTGCNGNGDNCIGSWLEECPESSNIFSNDTRRIFVHLNLSGLMPDLIFQSSTHDVTECKAGVSFPESTMDGNTYKIANRLNKKDIEMIYYNDDGFNYNNSFCYVGHWTDVYPFTPAEAKSIDEKLDDGNAIRGKVKAQGDVGCENINTGAYRVNNDEKYCLITAVIN
jgi:prepilin-type N-terminal cleavage/methylation domain-containing protein